jgi:hypothetical protein
VATALIPEVVQPGVLYVPNANNFFTVASGTMPNTDDALICDGTAGSFRAYQPAIADIHYPATPTQDFSILFWGWSPVGTTGASSNSSFSPNATMMCCTDPTLTGAVQTAAASTTAFRWGMCPSSTASATTVWNFHVACAASERWSVSGSTNTANSWKGIAIRHDQAGAPTVMTMHDFALNLLSSDTGTVGTPGAVTAPNFAIGPYSQLTLHRSYSYIIRLAKIAIFPTAYVTNTDLLDLLDSMTNGPPSP